MKKIIILSMMLLSFKAFSETTALELFNKAQNLQEMHMWFEAVDLYRECLEKNPQYSQAWFNLAKCSYALGSYDLAVEYADKAEKFSKNSPEIRNLKGMSLIALGKVEDAKTVFSEIIKKHPNNIDARFGLAEIDLLDGKITVAESRYKDALKRDEKNRKALLSLALVSAETGKDNIAEHYINQALSFYSGEVEVHYLASYLAAKAGDYKTAEQRARSAVQINGDFDKAYALLANILYRQKRYEEVIDICEFRIGRNRNLSDAWYLRGLCEEHLSRTAEAIETYETGLSINPQDEIMRHALEELVHENLTIEDSRRNYWASFHAQKALEYGRNFDGIAERYEYQKALSIAPLNNSIRQNFAKMLERDGLHELYLQQLRFMKENEAEDEAVPRTDENTPKKKRTIEQIRNDDAIESYQSLLANNLSQKWNVEPFYLDKTRWNIGLYYTKKNVQLFHANLEEHACYAAKTVFNGVPSASVNIISGSIKKYGDAFKLARREKLDYFIIMDAKETERTFSLDAVVYSGRTGTKTTEIHVYRTGNDCVAKSMQRFRSGVLEILPIRGKVIKNVQGKLLVDLGKNDGISKDCEFDIIRKGTITTKDEGPGVIYSNKDLLGKVKIVEINEEISEGLYEKNGFYDTLNVEDEIILTKSGTENQTKDGSAPSDSRPQADSSGEPATDAAKQARKESIKESLKPASRESDLVHLIRTII